MIEKHILRALVLEQLSRTPKTQIVNVTNSVERLVVERDLFPSSEDCQRLGIDFKYY